MKNYQLVGLSIAISSWGLLGISISTLKELEGSSGKLQYFYLFYYCISAIFSTIYSVLLICDIDLMDKDSSPKPLRYMIWVVMIFMVPMSIVGIFISAFLHYKGKVSEIFPQLLIWATLVIGAIYSLTMIIYYLYKTISKHMREKQKSQKEKKSLILTEELLKLMMQKKYDYNKFCELYYDQRHKTDKMDNIEISYYVHLCSNRDLVKRAERLLRKSSSDIEVNSKPLFLADSSDPRKGQIEIKPINVNPAHPPNSKQHTKKISEISVGDPNALMEGTNPGSGMEPLSLEMQPSPGLKKPKKSQKTSDSGTKPKPVSRPLSSQHSESNLGHLEPVEHPNISQLLAKEQAREIKSDTISVNLKNLGENSQPGSLRPTAEPRSDINNDLEQEPKCSICYVTRGEQHELFTLLCNHEFHIDCVKQWLGVSSRCPLCLSNCRTSMIEYFGVLK